MHNNVYMMKKLYGLFLLLVIFVAPWCAVQHTDTSNRLMYREATSNVGMMLERQAMCMSLDVEQHTPTTHHVESSFQVLAIAPSYEIVQSVEIFQNTRDLARTSRLLSY